MITIKLEFINDSEARALAAWLNHCDPPEPISPALLDDVAAQIENQLPKPRIPEPGKWGVVEAHHNGNAIRRRHVHTDPDEWVCVESGYFYSWPDLIDPVLIREGI